MILTDIQIAKLRICHCVMVTQALSLAQNYISLRLLYFSGKNSSKLDRFDRRRLTSYHQSRDNRFPSKPLLQYAESHNDDVTVVCSTEPLPPAVF